MDPIKYLRTLKRRWRLIVLCTLLGTVAGWVLTPSDAQSGDTENYFRATHTLIADLTGSQAPNLTQIAYLMKVGEIPERVSDRLGRGSAATIAQQVRPVARIQLGTLEVTAFGTNRQATEEVADAFAAETVAFLQAQAQESRDLTRSQLDTRLTDIEGRIAELDAQIGRGEGGELLVAQRDALVREYGIVYEDFQSLVRQPPPNAGLSTVQQAEAVPIQGEAFVQALREATGLAPDSDEAEDPNAEAGEEGDEEDVVSEAFSPSSSEPLGAPARAFLGGLAGLIAGIGIVLVLDRFDTRLRFKDDVEEAFALPVIAEIPPLTRRQRRHVSIVSVSEPHSRITEAYRNLRTSLQFMRPFVPGTSASGNGSTTGNGHGSMSEPSHDQVILVCSPGPTEGKTTTVANLAAVYAETGARVLVIDGDFRRPRVHEYLSTGPAVLAASAGGAPSSRLDDVASATEVPGVWAITELDRVFDPARPAELMAWIRDIVREARPRFDVILLDTAPLLDVNDANELLRVSDLVLLVCRAGKTNRRAGDRASEMLARLEAPVVGVTLVGAIELRGGRRYYYTTVRNEEETGGAGDKRRSRRGALDGPAGVTVPTGSRPPDPEP